LLRAEGRLGTLRPGATADVAVFELEEGRFEFRDTDGNSVFGARRLVTDLTLRGGRLWYSREAASTTT
jgi:dihydroorotase